MKVYFMRHGEASFVAPSDKERNLSAFGEQQVLENSVKFASVKRIVSSPVKRAVQSSELLSNVLKVSVEREEDWGLDADLSAQLQWLNNFGTDELLVVGHNPLISYLCTYLCDERLNFSTADVVCLESDYWERGLARLIS
jgi:phosphohistidine phosphatase